MKIYTRFALLMTLLVLLALSLTPVAGQEQIELEWWDYFGTLENADAALNDLIAAYMEEHPNVTITRTPLGFADLNPALIRGTATGELPDIAIIDNPDHQAFAAQGTLTDITDLIAGWEDAALYFPGPFSSTVLNGRNYGVPFDSNATALYYNADLLGAAGVEPPTTWEELRAAAAALTQGNVYGFCFSAAPGEEGTFTFLPFVWQAGGDIQTYGDEASIAALTFINDLVNVDMSVSPQVVSMGQGDCYNEFIAGTTAMMINGPWQLPGLEASGVEFEWGVVPWPGNVESTSILGGQNLAIPTGANAEAAWNVIDWMTDPENNKVWLQGSGQLPNRSDLAEDPDFAEDPILQTFIGQVEIARPRAYGPGYPQMSAIIINSVQGVLTGALSPEEAAAQAATELEPLVAELMSGMEMTPEATESS